MAIRNSVVSVLCLLLVSGCVPAQRTEPRAGAGAPRIMHDSRLHGRIATVNLRGQFVVVDFNVGAIPPLPAKMNIYRGNDIVGRIRLGGPANDNLVAGDILEGELRVGDVAIWDAEQADPKQP